MKIVFISRQERLLLMAVFMVLTGCATLTQDEAQLQILEMVDTYTSLPGNTGPGEIHSGQIDSAASAAQAALHSKPQIAADLAALGLDRADLIDARRLTNPGLSLALLDTSPSDEQGRFSASISHNIMELLLYPIQKDFGDQSFEIAQQETALRVMNAVLQAKRAWFSYSAATLLVQVNERAAATAELAAELAGRYAQAGNLNALILARYRADAVEARITLTESRRTLAQAEANLVLATGINDANTFKAQLPLVPDELAPGQHADEQVSPNHPRIIAQTARIELLKDIAQLNRRLRLIGQVQAGVEYEREGDGAKLLGPNLSLALPVFSQGQSAIARADAELAVAQARGKQIQQELNALYNRAKKDFQLTAMLALELKDKLVPERQAVYQRALEQVNFMLTGVFDLVAARQELFAAWQSFIEVSRDHWIASLDLEFAQARIDLQPPATAAINLDHQLAQSNTTSSHHNGNH